MSQDKLLRATMCFTLDVLCAALGFWDPARRFIFVAVGIGGAKEIYDLRYTDRDVGWGDVIADAVGAFVGELVVLVLRG